MLSKVKARCERCTLHRELCICSLIPRLETQARVVILMHALEEKKPSNTGRLAHLCLPNSEIRLRGSFDRSPMSFEGLVREDKESWMLFLSDTSEELSPELVAAAKKPIQLLVPDGTWAQASRLGSMLAKKLPTVKHVKLKASKPTQYLLRTEHHPDGMATFEAIARSLGVIEGAKVQEEMEKIFQVMIDRVLWTRGKLPAEKVSGGIPGKT